MRSRDCLALLTGAEDDERAMRPWTGNARWAGLVRALFLTLRAERGDRTRDAGSALSRLPDMNEN